MCCIVRPAGLGGALGRLQERLVHFRCWMLVGSGGLVGVVCRVGVVAAGGVVLCCRTGACFGLVGRVVGWCGGVWVWCWWLGPGMVHSGGWRLFRCRMLVGSGGLVGVVCRVGVVAAGLGGASPCAHCRQLDALFR